jgi:hypothetical protein
LEAIGDWATCLPRLYVGWCVRTFGCVCRNLCKFHWLVQMPREIYVANKFVRVLMIPKVKYYPYNSLWVPIRAKIIMVSASIRYRARILPFILMLQYPANLPCNGWTRNRGSVGSVTKRRSRSSNCCWKTLGSFLYCFLNFGRYLMITGKLLFEI